MRAMLGNRRLIERAAKSPDPITTANITAGGTGGWLNPEQSDRFIDYVVDQSVMFKDGIRVRRMTTDRADLDKLAVGARIIRKATENDDSADTVGITTSKRQLVVTEIVLPADVTFSFMEDNIERDGFEEHLMSLFGIQLANDLEDLAINGDGTTAGFLAIEKGWIKLMVDESDPNIIYDTNGSQDFRNVVFEGMLSKLPAKFKANKGALRFYVSVGDAERYQYQLGQRQTAGGDSALAGQVPLTYGGIPVRGVPYMADGKSLLTLPDNLVFGVRRAVSLGIFRNERKRVWEYTWTMRIDYEIVEPTAAVLAYNA